MKKIRFILPAILVLLGSMASASSLDENLLEELKTAGSISHVFLNQKKVELSLTPETELSQNATVQWTGSEKPRMTTEKLFYLEKTGDADIEKVSKVVRSISTMKGTDYYSNRHKKWETLYHDASLIKSKKDKSKIADDTEGSADGKTLYCMQDDNSFGKCYYELKYRQLENEVSVCFDNFEALKFGPITAAKAHNVKINLVVVDEGEYFLVYMVVEAFYPRISMLEEKMISSFNARVDSIYKWFNKELNN